MGRFKCKLCKKSKDIAEYTVKVVENKVIVPEAICCENYMQQQREKGTGFATIRKGPDGSVKRKPRPWE
jgi:hypothetical protein